MTVNGSTLVKQSLACPCQLLRVSCKLDLLLLPKVNICQPQTLPLLAGFWASASSFQIEPPMHHLCAQSQQYLPSRRPIRTVVDLPARREQKARSYSIDQVERE